MFWRTFDNVYDPQFDVMNDFLVIAKSDNAKDECRNEKEKEQKSNQGITT